MYSIRREPLSVEECCRAVAHEGAGALNVFLGTVRDNHQGQATESLEYEAYTTMAEKEMRAIGEEIEREIAGVRLSCQHRIGHLQVGDVAVICVASAPHREEAFRACRALIDRIKQRVPIWKREHGPGGTSWTGWEDATRTSR